MGVSLLEGQYVKRITEALENINLKIISGHGSSDSESLLRNNIIVERNLLTNVLWSRDANAINQYSTSIFDISPEHRYALWVLPLSHESSINISITAYDDSNSQRYHDDLDYDADLDNIYIYANPESCSKFQINLSSEDEEFNLSDFINAIFFGEILSDTDLTEIEMAYLQKKLGIGNSIGSVRYDIDQTADTGNGEIDSTAQAIIQKNIGLDDINSLVTGTVKYNIDQTADTGNGEIDSTAQAIIQKNIGLDDINSLVTGTVKYNIDQTADTGNGEIDSTAQAIIQKNIGLDNINSLVTGTVKYDAVQNLDTSQKEQARSNIGAISYEVSQTVLDTTQKSQARTNIGAASQTDVDELNDSVSNVAIDSNGNALVVDHHNGESNTVSLGLNDYISDVRLDTDENLLRFYNKDANELVNIKLPKGGGSGTGSAATVVIDRIGSAAIDSIYGQDVNLTFKMVAKDASGELVGNGTATWEVNGVRVDSKVIVPNNVNTSYNIGPKLVIGNNTIRLTVSVDVNESSNYISRKTWTVNAIDMRFVWNYNDAQINVGQFDDRCVVYGNVLKTIHTVIGNTELPTKSTTASNSTQTILIPKQPHGAYGVERWLSATINNAEHSTDHQYHEIIFVDNDNTTPIIAISLKAPTIEQYTTLDIPVIIYDPESLTSNATLYVDDSPVSRWTNQDRTIHHWFFTSSDVGNADILEYEKYSNEDGTISQKPKTWMHTLKIEVKADRIINGNLSVITVQRELNVIVNALSLDITEVPGYSFKFKASDFASNDSVKEWTSGDNINASFSENFDWINGGIKTEMVDNYGVEVSENGILQQYFCIKAGTSMTINHKLFENNPKYTGLTFKIAFKIKHCRNYDTQIVDCSYNTRGIRMYAHKAELFGGSEGISIPYDEDGYMELEFDIYPDRSSVQNASAVEKKQTYMIGWLDGVITTCRSYKQADTFGSGVNSSYITLGSDSCDLYIYLIKAYHSISDHANNLNNHIANFIMDAPNASEMISRYERNDIVDDATGKINYQKLVDNNPDLRVWLYEIPYMTNDKSDKVGKSSEYATPTFQQIWKNGDAYYQMTGKGIMSVQGTSSVKYIRGAANIDFNFTELEYTDNNGNIINLLDGGTNKGGDIYGGSNNWYVADEEHPNVVKIFTVQDAKIDAGIIRSYTPEEAMRISNVNSIDLLGNNWIVYKSDSNNNPMIYINSNDSESGEEFGPEWVVIERNANNLPTKYIKALGLKLNDDSCPITYANTKVNFASCEQVNNMINARWYQRYNPYPSLTKRDCMELVMGVQFIKDHGERSNEVVGENESPHFSLFDDDNNYYMYSIANMGTSKKNVHLFHDLANEDEACIEVKDSGDPEHMMTVDHTDQNSWAGDGWYEMRYPDTKNPSDKIKSEWKKLVSWFANNNPNAATNEPIQPETYRPYTFRGHDRPGEQVLKGHTIYDYVSNEAKESITYTVDSFERRMAKMIYECEDHLVMDSFVYHFVYLERHTMVDNLAKNNFWSTSDLNSDHVHWDLSKAYDMDTSDGNNNNGRLVYDYGLEYNDFSDNASVFNGYMSVWFQFIGHLYEACQIMFRNRESYGAWSAANYHREMLSEQRKVPERCWIQCYDYDYIRTYENDINDKWIEFLDGGQKTHQRRHYETFQELYMSSKYSGSASTSQFIKITAYSPETWGGVMISTGGARLRSSPSASSSTLTIIPYGTKLIISEKVYANNTNWRKVRYNEYVGYVETSNIASIEPLSELTISMYAKMYVSIFLGTMEARRPEKVEARERKTIRFSDSTEFSNSMVYINTASMVQTLDGVEQLYARDCEINGAQRLKEIAIGSNRYGYYNNNLSSISFANNSVLERVYVQNLPNATGTLDLSNCPGLVYVDATGSGFSGYQFANGALVETAFINSPTVLVMRQLTNLNDGTETIVENDTIYSDWSPNVPYYQNDIVYHLHANYICLVDNSDSIFDDSKWQEYYNHGLFIDDYSRLEGLYYEGPQYEDWVPNTQYNIGDRVHHEYVDYVCLHPVSSETFSITSLIDNNQEIVWKRIGINLYALVNRAQNLTVARIINGYWNTTTSDMLDRFYIMSAYDENGNDTTYSPAVLTGAYHSTYHRERTYNTYVGAWPDLTITYNNLIPQHCVRFYQDDQETPIYEIIDGQRVPYIQYVDDGEDAHDPRDDGLPTPIKASDGQNSYTFAGWDRIPTRVIKDENVYATYDEQLLEYVVEWYEDQTLSNKLATTRASYGDAVRYSDHDANGRDYPIKENSGQVYNVFKRWSDSTGFIKNNMKVYAIWDSSRIPSDTSKRLSTMTVPEIYAISQSHIANNYWSVENRDYIDIQVGRDFEFDNVESEVILENRFFNGEASSLYRRNDIKLFDADSPSFTLAIDYEFSDTASNAVLASCYEVTNGAVGFKLQHNVQGSNDNIDLTWGDKSVTIAHGTNRGIVVIRHRKGSNSLHIHSDNGGKSLYMSYITDGNADPERWNTDENDIYSGHYRYCGYSETTLNSSSYGVELTRSQNLSTTYGLSFGGSGMGTSGVQVGTLAKGWIHWCKIWYDDLGRYVGEDLACWPHETWRMEYCGNQLYNTDSPNDLTGATFIANAMLPQFYNYVLGNDVGIGQQYISGSLTYIAGWDNVQMRQFLNRRCYQALPIQWQYILRKTQLTSILPKSSQALESDILMTTTYDNLFVPSRSNLVSNINDWQYLSEGPFIPWFTENKYRIKFMGITIPLTARYFTDATVDPSTYETAFAVEGDIWIRENVGYIYVSQDTINKHYTYGGRPITHGSNIVASGPRGGMWIKGYRYWTRTPNGTNRGSLYMYITQTTGNLSTGLVAYESGTYSTSSGRSHQAAPLIMFSI